ncbi:hypothetical protein MUN81_13675 [Hymenobacter sp. 5317J-9]|uniref:hypothetical protein n=1 Tax=Hymenobacter sp. 5317J-9 TaxID=2932250 RepID=UPI001FD63D76|nr:hypothetical protein [Hymenobacter sp. 5317J-9]UOQ96298.1 hypothetical protein MUN81_13675 [Hymenobacter sp. 5317J-9]
MLYQNVMKFLRKSAWLACVLLPAAMAPGPRIKQGLAAARMTLAVPAGWVEVPVIANEDMSYEYAVRHPKRRLEVRYALRPLAGMLAEYARSKKQKDVTMVDPNEMYQTLFRTVKLNIGPHAQPGQSMDDMLAAEFAQPLNEFPAAAIKEEFGADWGATAILQPRASFGQRYKQCLVVALHKRNAADAYCFFMFDDQADLKDVVFGDPAKSPFHSLRFL